VRRDEAIMSDRYNFHPPRQPRPCAVLDRIGDALDRGDLTITAVDAARGTVTVGSLDRLPVTPSDYLFMNVDAYEAVRGAAVRCARHERRRARMARKKRKGWA
jgi:hypothetical protein